jgi:2-oxoglutarate ferredoxin oxidoreductase subunit alpha
MVKAENLLEIMRNTGIIGAFCKISGIDWNILETVFKNGFGTKAEPNLKIAKLAYDAVKESIKIKSTGKKPAPMVSGNEAVSLGLINGGLKAYISYPMTPTSPILHFLAGVAEKFSLKVIHPENEIAVMLMATGFAYCGQKVAVGTSGGGFCLMTEGLSFSAMAELPVVIVLGQRPGPSTGLPTYSAQTELHFALNAGHGEFPRLIVAPGDAEESYYWSNLALNLSWKYQLPAFVLTDKTLGEGIYSFDYDSINDAGETNPELWDKNGAYKRYLYTETGVSTLAFPPETNAVIKVSSYQHDEAGITVEDAGTTVKMLDKILRKEKYLSADIDNYEAVKTYGNIDSDTALLCWGSNKGACIEAAKKFGFRVIQSIALYPFPAKQFKKALNGVKKLIAIENNATAQLVRLINDYGFDADEKILRYDGRPFTIDELETEIGRIK